MSVPDHNTVPLTRPLLLLILADFSNRILHLFGRQIRLVIHGGAVLLLHPTLSHTSPRQYTRDVDYISRSFIAEWAMLGVPDAAYKLQACIDATAQRYGLGRDWANAHADVALPMAPDAVGLGPPYDPIYVSSVTPSNIATQTLFRSPGLHLIGVPPSWGVALKLVRYEKHDPADICAILRGGGRGWWEWTEEGLERWLRENCTAWERGVARDKGDVVRARLGDVVKRVRWELCLA